LQDLDISINEWAVIFCLPENESGVIWCSHFGFTFHGGCPFYFCSGDGEVMGKVEGAEIDFAFEIGEMCFLIRDDLKWRSGTVL
jgi:hypothetical protein